MNNFNDINGGRIVMLVIVAFVIGLFLDSAFAGVVVTALGNFVLTNLPASGEASNNGGWIYINGMLGRSGGLDECDISEFDTQGNWVYPKF